MSKSVVDSILEQAEGKHRQTYPALTREAIQCLEGHVQRTKVHSLADAVQDLVMEAAQDRLAHLEEMYADDGQTARQLFQAMEVLMYDLVRQATRATAEAGLRLNW